MQQADLLTQRPGQGQRVPSLGDSAQRTVVVHCECTPKDGQSVASCRSALGCHENGAEDCESRTMAAQPAI